MKSQKLIIPKEYYPAVIKKIWQEICGFVLNPFNGKVKNWLLKFLIFWDILRSSDYKWMKYGLLESSHWDASNGSNFIFKESIYRKMYWFIIF